MAIVLHFGIMVLEGVLFLIVANVTQIMHCIFSVSPNCFECPYSTEAFNVCPKPPS